MGYYDTETVLSRHLENILSDDVDYDEEEAEENSAILWDTLSGLIRVMKDVDTLFREIYVRPVHAGSYYEGLRVNKPDEFDIQVVIKFPFEPSSFTICVSKDDSAFMTYRLKQPPRQILQNSGLWRKPYKKLSNFFNSDGLLCSDRVLKWFLDLMEKAVDSDDFTLPRTVSEIQRKSQPSSCPAFTLEITGADSGETIDVDVVPVLDTGGIPIPRKVHKSKRFRQLLHSEKCVQWFLVPKPSKQNTEDSKAQVLWRNTFPSAEKQLLNDTGCLKDVIKLFKRLRDLNGNWIKPIYSYVLKSFFMREFDKNPDLEYWSDENLGQVFLESLEEFQGAMERSYVPDYFSPKSNMIANINPDAARNIAGRVRNIVNNLKEEPDSILDIF